MSDQGDILKDAMLGERNTPSGTAKIEYFGRYYDITNTIQIAGPTNPNNADANIYNEEKVNDSLQRNAPFLRLVNDGTDNLYAIVSHGGGQTFSQENIIYPGDVKDYINVYELRLRSPTQDLPYRVSEYRIERTCCPTSTSVTTTLNTASINDIRFGKNVTPTWIHATEQTAPGAGTVLVSKTVSAGKVGFIYGFLISAQEANDFKINWTSGSVARSIRIVFGGKGSTQDTEIIPINEGLGADGSSIITITNISAAGIGTIYQARLLYAEI